MADKIDTSTLGRIDLASGGSPAPAPIEECVSTWANNERLRDEVAAIVKSWLGDHAISLRPAAWRELRDALSHKDMT